MQQNCFRPGWDDYFMAVARIIATRSTCDRLHTGAVLVKNKRIISTGYNGSPPGLPHCSDADGHLMEDGHCVRTIHAEHNAILQTAANPGQSTEGATVYTLYSPCIHCAKYLIAAGIKRVVIGNIYRNDVVLDYMQKAGLEVEFYKPNAAWNELVRDLFKKEIKEVVAKEGYVVLEEKKIEKENFTPLENQNDSLTGRAFKQIY